MSRILVLASKEFRSYFSSWVAYLFIAIFFIATFSLFFFVEKFFGVGRADARGLFAWLPLTLAFLVPGLTMRQWAREREMGSVEVLLTLPASPWELVVGKFFGCLGLVAVALLFTIGMPITAAWLGDLDWGPVIGGYVAALLLGGAYVAIGLFVSSWFADQFIALIAAGFLCILLAVMSSEAVLAWADGVENLRETLSFVGFWSRFDAIERGVLDLRDIGFYLSVTLLFLFLNSCRLRLMRWS
jgi:ABC-type transport system involved in multi-copper enzyme maturation permease subunit